MIRTMFCHKCQKEQEIVLSESGPHTKASCLEGHYLKFMSQEELTGKPKGGNMTHEISIELPGNQYGEVIVIEEYQGNYGLVLAKKGTKEGTLWKKWCYPQVKGDGGKEGKSKPAEKAIPLKIPLGNREDAVKVVREIAKAFGIYGVGVTGGQTVPPDDDDLPF